MIYLTEADILAAAVFDDIIEAMETAMSVYETKAFNMPQRLHVDNGSNTLLLMPCFIQDYFATKLVTLFPTNPAKGIPMLNGIVVLNNGKTGLPVAILDGRVLTALRTAAVSSVSIRHLTAEDIFSLGIVGAGFQGFYHAWVACSIRNLTDIIIFDSNPEKTAVLIEKLSDVVPHVKFHATACIEDLLEKSQVVVTATTSQKPVLPERADLLIGKHFVAIGSYQPNVRELPRALFNLLQRVFIDTTDALEESGDLIVPLQNRWLDREQIMTLGSFLARNRKRESVKHETTLFKSVGMALFDVYASKIVYESAVQKGLGQKIVL
jgi:ornithine cyclodeaminase